MNLLFDIGHPAHVHLFRNLINKVQKNGGKVLAATREKDVTVELCRLYNIPQVILSQAYSGNLLSGFWEFIIRTIKLFRLARSFKPDALLGTSTSIGIVGHLINRPSFLFEEDDAAVIPLFAHFVYPTCTYIVSPECLNEHEDYGKKHLTYKGYHELAYLHPDYFTPDSDAIRSIGLSPDETYFILRFVSLKAHHDINAEGLSFKTARTIIGILADHGRVLITSEGDLPSEFKQYYFPLPPDKLHDVLAFASLCISDSQTVSSEASILGIPNLRCNTFVGRLAYLEELENKYHLTKGFLPSETGELLGTIKEWLLDITKIKQDMQFSRRKMLADCINLTDWQWQTLCNKLISNKGW